MLYKESAIAVVVAVMLGTASLFGGFSMIPALATHDPDAIEIASEQVTQAGNATMAIDAIELTAEKSTTRTTGMITVEVIQDDDVLASASLRTSDVSTAPGTVQVGMAGVDVTGSFEILVEYLGNGRITVSDIGVVEGTGTAEEPEEPAPGGDAGDDESDGGPAMELENENVIATETVSQAAGGTMTVETVEFSAEKSTTRATGTLTIALVQNDEVLDTDVITTRSISTMFEDFEAFFDEELTDDFQVVFIYEGNGRVTVKDINVPGATEPAEEEPPAPPGPDPDGTLELTVNAVDQNSQDVPDMWVAVLQGMSLVDSGFTEAVFTLEAGETYTVEMGDFFDEETGTNYEFDGWADSNQTNRRTAELDADQEYTAKYIVTNGAAPPPDDPDPPSDPPGSEPGTITVFAHRIPSEHWGPTFTGANAEMYFVLYNSTGWIVHTGFFDEDGHAIAGLNEGETYWISPTDCDECHGDPHDVVFDHWEDDSTERQRAATTGTSAHAYYAYDPDP